MDGFFFLDGYSITPSVPHPQSILPFSITLINDQKATLSFDKVAFFYFHTTTLSHKIMCRLFSFIFIEVAGGGDLSAVTNNAVLYIGFSLCLWRSFISRVVHYAPSSRVPQARHILCDNPDTQQGRGSKDTHFLHIRKRMW